MSEIPEIGVQNINIPSIEAPGIYNYVPHTKVYPFILNIGSPVVNMPGCVTVSYTHLTLPTICSV